MSTVAEFYKNNKLISLLIGAIIVVGLGFLVYQSTAKTITFSVSEPGATLTLNGDVHKLDSNAITLKLQEKDYQVQVEKPGFEAYAQVIHPSTSTIIKIPLRVRISEELTSALPESVNQAGFEFKVAQPAYLENGTWAVAKVVQFESSDQDLDQLYAVFKKTPTGWKLVAGPLSELAPEDKTVQLLPEKVHSYLEKKL